MLPLTLPLWFFVTAALYAAVGFGGGSTYTALLAMVETEIWRIPIMALMCNITVVALGSFLAVRRRAFDWRAAVPFFVASVPLAFLGGLVPLRDAVYVGLLGLSLGVAGVHLLFADALPAARAARPSWPKALTIGGGLGFLSGMVGIGGGIFLAPVLHYVRWADSKQIAALCSFFILVNSVAGLAGQLVKNGSHVMPEILASAAPLLGAVLLGGLLGGRVLLERATQKRVRQATAILIIFVAMRLFWQLYI